MSDNKNYFPDCTCRLCGASNWDKNGRCRECCTSKDATYKDIHGQCEDAPCCGCCGQYDDDYNEYFDY